MKILVNSLDNEVICDFAVPSKMKKVWNVELNILDTVQTICRKHGISYYAIGGTLLGAVRHQGFIPWDDDMDIGMPRKDYDCFSEIVDSELPKEMFAQTYRNTRSFPYDMIKIRNSNTTGFTPWEKDEEGNKGIFLDIFPIDNVPDNSEERNHENREIKNLLYKAVLMSRKTESSGSLKIFKVVVKAIMRKFGAKGKIKTIQHAIEICSSHNNEDTQYCAMRSFSMPERYKWRRNNCTELIEVPFENTVIMIPKGYDDILTSIYGDYRVYVKADSYHEGTIFDPDTPYMDYQFP